MNNAEGRRIFLPLNDRCKDGRLYQVNHRARNGIIYLRCHNSTICYGTAKFENQRLSHGRAHSEDCMIDESAALIGAFKQSLKDSLARHWYKLRDLFDQTALLYPEAAALVNFQSMRSYMLRCRRSAYPARPATLIEFSEQLTAPANARMLEYATGRFTTSLITDRDDNPHLVIYDEQFVRLEIARDVTKIFIDATFRSTPNMEDAYQLLTILGIKFNHGIPFIWVVMSRKLESSYSCVFNYVRDHVLRGAQISLIMSDFEAAIRNAASNTFVDAHCTGCNTHYDRAVLQKMKSLGLQALIREDEEAKMFVKKMLVLAYLPTDAIERHYRQMKNELPPRLRRRFTAFLVYYERYWLRTVSPGGFSVFGLSRRTNNIVESYNSKLGYHLQAHPSPWAFISKLLILQNHAKCDIERLKRRSGGITRHARYQTTYKNQQLQKAWKDLYYRKITVDEFVLRATFLKGDISQKIARESNDREGGDFEIVVAPRAIPLEMDPDYDAEIFRDVFPGPFMRDNAEQLLADRDHGNPIPARPVTPERQIEAAEMPVQRVVGPDNGEERPADRVHANPIPARLATPERQMEAADILVQLMPLRPATPEMPAEDQELDWEIRSDPPTPEPVPIENELDWEIRSDPPTPEPVPIENDFVMEEGPIEAQEELPVAEGPQNNNEDPGPAHPQPLVQEPAQVAAGSRRARRRQRQRQRRRNIMVALNAPQVAEAGVAIGRKRRRSQGSNKPKCVICMIRRPTHAFLPCGHKCCCEECSMHLYETHGTRTCPACRTRVDRPPVQIYD